MSKDSDFYLKIEFRHLRKVRGDPALMLWYGALRDYARKFKPDKTGYIRLSKAVVDSDYGINRRQIQRMNGRLEELGLIEIDKLQRGGRTPMGYRIK